MAYSCITRSTTRAGPAAHPRLLSHVGDVARARSKRCPPATALILWDMRGHDRSDYPTDPAAYLEAASGVADMAAVLDATLARETGHRR